MALRPIFPEKNPSQGAGRVTDHTKETRDEQSFVDALESSAVGKNVPEDLAMTCFRSMYSGENGQLLRGRVS
jgi:hypothetical protein